MARRRSSRVKNLGSMDRGLLILWMILISFGLLMIASAGSIKAHVEFIDEFGRSDNFWYLKRQAMWLGISSVALAFFSRFDYRKLRYFAFPALLAVILLLAAVFLPIISSGEILGARRWLNFGAFGLQPSELAKITLAVYLATWLERKGKEVQDFKYGFLPFAFVLSTIITLLFLQKDLGTTIIIVVMAVTVFFVSGAHLAQLAGGIALGSMVVITFIRLTPFRVDRITAWLDPASDPQGIGWHLTQARLTIGSGGWFGLGYGHSLQKYQFLPHAPTDSIYAIIAEELGLIGAAGLMVLYGLFLYRIYRIALGAGDNFGKLLAVGIGVWIGIQAFINIGGLLRIIPLTGVPLPFISYGGSSLLMTSIAIGIVLSISRSVKHKETHAYSTDGRGDGGTRRPSTRAGRKN